MMPFLYNHKLIILGVVLGALLGYAYWHEVGCANGTCLITSRPLNSSFYGAIMGGLLGSIFKK